MNWKNKLPFCSNKSWIDRWHFRKQSFRKNSNRTKNSKSILKLNTFDQKSAWNTNGTFSKVSRIFFQHTGVHLASRFAGHWSAETLLKRKKSTQNIPPPPRNGNFVRPVRAAYFGNLAPVQVTRFCFFLPLCPFLFTLTSSSPFVHQSAKNFVISSNLCLEIRYLVAAEVSTIP